MSNAAARFFFLIRVQHRGRQKGIFNLSLFSNFMLFIFLTNERLTPFNFILFTFEALTSRDSY
jgi:hypothetical protein